MKNIIRFTGLLIITCFAFISCDPQVFNDHELGPTPTAEQLDFSINPRAEQPNVVEFTNNSQITGVAVWNFGNNTTGKGGKVTAGYPYKGEYTVTLTLYTPGGATSISKVINIADDDPTLLDTPFFNALTGGIGNADGKTWVFDQYIAGHFGVGPVNSDGGDINSPSWWSAGPDAKLECSLYENEFTFKLDGLTILWKNKGKIYTNGAGLDPLKSMGYPNSSVPPAGDFDVEYTPKESYTFSLDEAGGILTLSDDAFFGHFAGTSTYTIVKLTEDEMYLRCDSKTETSNRWWYRFVPKEKNVKPEIPLKAVPLSEDFEGNKFLNFVQEDMGNVSKVVDNPAPLPVHESDKVFRYWKAKGYYSNLSFTASNYKFDLTTQNKIHVKVYIPSYNDYDTENAAESWISEKRLRPQLAVKLHDSSHPAPWEGQTEIIKADLELDKWIELEFDFSGVANREDYDKIVIQFGGEGHGGSGFFFMDDFEFK